MKLYYIHKDKLDLIKPSVPKGSFYVKQGWEDNEVRRIKCSNSIENELSVYGDLVSEGDEFWVYEFDSKDYPIIHNKELIEQKLANSPSDTNEYWCLGTIKPDKKYKIRITGLDRKNSKVVREKIDGKFKMREVPKWNYVAR